MSTKVFYAWQSDRNPQICRFLIRDAIKKAIKRLKAEAKVQEAPPFELDHDTKGTTGHPHIAATVRRKIRECGVFVADLTHVAEYQTADRRTKRSQNANVLIELGIAIRAKGFGRLLLVMNEAFGSPEDLPFDLKSHNFPITYTLGDSADAGARKTVAEQLSGQIAAKLKDMFAAVQAEAAAAEEKEAKATASASREEAERQRRAFEKRVLDGQFYGMSGCRCIAAVCVIPAVSLAMPLTLKEGVLLKGGGGDLRPMGVEFGGSYERAARTLANLGDMSPEQGRKCATEITNRGSIFAAHHWLWWDSDDKDIGRVIAFDMSHYEPEICGAVFRYLRLLRALRQVGPWYVSYSLLNAKNTKLNPVSNYRNVFDQQHVFGGDHVAPDPVVIPADFTGDEQALMTLLRPALDQFWAEYRNLYGARSYDESGRYRHVGQW